MYLLAISKGQGLEPTHWARVLASGVDGFMIREPQLEAGALLAAALWVQDQAPGLELWLNGRLDVAMAARFGCHAPESYPPVPAGLLPLSRPIHQPDQIPARSDARQLILSPIFPVPGKGEPWGPERLFDCLNTLPPTSARILALGGLTPDRLPALRHPRLDGIALIRALWDAPDPAQMVASLRTAWT